MIVYVVMKMYEWSDKYDGAEIVGVYGTAPKAHTKIDALEKKKKKPPEMGYGPQFVYIVIEMRLQ